MPDNNIIEKDLGPVSAWAIAKANGFDGTEAEWEALQANAAQNGSDAEAFAKGTRNGEAVASDDPAYHNNCAYHHAGTSADADTCTTKAAEATAAAATASAAYNVNLLAPNYSAESTYAVGDHVIYNGGYYECISAISTAEAWTAAHWRQLTVGGESADLKSAFVNYQKNDLPFTLVQNSYVMTNGTFAPYTGWARTEYVPVSEYYSITAKTSESSIYNCFYKSNFEKINYFTVETAAETILIPEEAAYVALSNTAAGMETLEVSFVTKDRNNIDMLNSEVNGKNSYTDAIGYQKLMFESSEYNSTYHYFPLTIIGHNTKTVIFTNGGKLFERINNVNYPVASESTLVLNGTHYYRVYNDDNTAIPYYLIESESWIGGYPTYGETIKMVVVDTRCTKFIRVNKYHPIDIDCDDGVQFDLNYITSSGSVSLETRGLKHFTINEGYYAIVIMGSNTSATVTDAMINGVHISEVQFPKITGFPFYEEIKYTKNGEGAQGICCSSENVFVFNGLGNVCVFDFNGNFIDRKNIPVPDGKEQCHCNSATYNDGYFYVVHSGEDGYILKLNENFEIVGNPIDKAGITSLAYSDDGYFYEVKAESFSSSSFASGVNLYRLNPDLSNETLIAEDIITDAAFVLQGMEIQGDYIILPILNTNYYGIIAYFTKNGNLVRWRYAQVQKELEDVAINQNGEIFVSYQGNIDEGLPMILTKCTNVITYNASEEAKSVITGLKIGKYKEPLLITADEDHAVFSGEIAGTMVEQGNLARVSANVLPHIINKYFYKGFLCNSGSTAKDNMNLPLLAVASGSGTKIEFEDLYMNLKNNRWNTSAL